MAAALLEPATGRERVLDAAAERFVVQGYAATTLRQIAGDVGQAAAGGEERGPFAAGAHRPAPFLAEGRLAALRTDPERAGAFTRMLYEIHVPLADTFAEALGGEPVVRVLDAGGEIREIEVEGRGTG